ncbi:MAG: hypothetical protein HY234_09320 [Acidobacteria bacterium]|nr:hypothetical protein [Acidobacteriota bacterium]MBI3663235.1 hypothetical protein [Acidobacteriota bacterium]
MNSNRESLLLAGTEALVLLSCLGAIIWTVASGMIFDIDGLLLLMISLALSAVFAFTLILHAKSEGWLEKLPAPGRKKAATEAESKAPPAEKVPVGDAK